MTSSTTIIAPATAAGGALSIVRLSGGEARSIVERYFRRDLAPRVATFGAFYDDQSEVIDEVVVTYYTAPHSFTGEDMIEISCHGSPWITSEIVRLLVAAGATVAAAGEFSMRAFLDGKMDLSQTEAIADLIASESRSAARVAMQQMRGGYSAELRLLRDELLKVLSLLELELDFGEEDVEFADRTQLRGLVEKIEGRVRELASSFRLGNVLKNGVPVAIVGRPNVGKSTLLNGLVGEERAIVSATAGTTRDFIEERVTIDGIVFRFIDTAGLRESRDEIERIGIERSREKLACATIVLHLIDSQDDNERFDLSDDQTLLTVFNKSDLLTASSGADLAISAKSGQGVEELKQRLVGIATQGFASDSDAVVVSNARHYEALIASDDAFQRAIEAINDELPTDLISAEIRQGLNSLQEITGEITSDNVLHNIFANFCIGK